jgi:hypothetical protein
VVLAQGGVRPGGLIFKSGFSGVSFFSLDMVASAWCSPLKGRERALYT